MITEVSILVAAGAGVLSFLSPCVLPLVPSYLAFLGGMALTGQEGKRPTRPVLLLHAALFILGFSLVFVALGASISLLGRVLFQYQDTVRRVGGVLIVLFGLIVAGVIKLPWLLRDWRVHFRERPAGFLGSVFVGITFGAGWTPCVGPVLGSILTLAGTAQTAGTGMQMLAAYAAGLGIPFFLSALLLDRFAGFFERFRPLLRFVDLVAGAILVLVGILLITNYMTVLNGYFIRLTPEWLWNRL